MPQILYSEQELSTLQELQNKKAALFKQYGEIEKERSTFMAQNIKQLMEKAD